MSSGEAPVDGGEEGALEVGDLGRSEAAHAREGRVGAESVAVLEERETTETIKQCMVRDDVNVGLRA